MYIQSSCGSRGLLISAIAIIFLCLDSSLIHTHSITHLNAPYVHKASSYPTFP